MSETASPAGYPVATIAKLLDLTERQVYALAARGVLPRADRGRYEIAPVVRAYIRYLRERIPGDTTAKEFTSSRARLLTARAQKAEAEIGLLKGTLLRRDDVEAAWSAITLNMRARLLALPSGAAPAVRRARSVREIAAVLKDAVHDALSEIAATVVYAAPDSAGILGADRRGDAGAAEGGAAAEPDAVAMG